MGGDSAPADPVRGARAAACARSDLSIILVGIKDVLEEECSRNGGLPGNVSIVHAPEFVEMNESPVDALRRKKNTSIARVVQMIASGEADAMISAGNTGATVVAATLGMKMLNGVRRPGIAAPIPTADGICAVIDVGANIKCKPEHLLQYGYMGEIYARIELGVDNPRIGLLNVGEEDAKGNDLVKLTRELLEKSDLNFIGNVEGREIFLGECDVAVSEGFVGNVLLKAIEGLAESIFKMIDANTAGSLLGRLGALMTRPSYDRLKARMTYEAYGGAPLLGTNGVCFICHGRSNEKAIHNAITTAARFVENEMTSRISERIAQNGVV